MFVQVTDTVFFSVWDLRHQTRFLHLVEDPQESNTRQNYLVPEDRKMQMSEHCLISGVFRNTIFVGKEILQKLFLSSKKLFQKLFLGQKMFRR